jgi:hypothetical protein
MSLVSRYSFIWYHKFCIFKDIEKRQACMYAFFYILFYEIVFSVIMSTICNVWIDFGSHSAKFRWWTRWWCFRSYLRLVVLAVSKGKWMWLWLSQFYLAMFTTSTHNNEVHKTIFNNLRYYTCWFKNDYQLSNADVNVIMLLVSSNYTYVATSS